MEIVRSKTVHWLPGRIRLRVPGLRGNPKLAQSIEGHLAGLPGISGIQVNVRTGTVLTQYSPQYWDGYGVILVIEDKRQEDLAQLACEQEIGRKAVGLRISQQKEAGLNNSVPRAQQWVERHRRSEDDRWGEGKRRDGEKRRSGRQRRVEGEVLAERLQRVERQQVWNLEMSRRQSQEDIRVILKSPSVTRRSLKTIFSGFALMALLAKRQILGPSLLAGSQIVVDAATLIGLVSAYPLFLWGLKHPQQTKRLHYDAIINVLSFSLLILQESINGLLLTLLVNGSKLSMGIDQAKARQIIRQVGVLPQKAWQLVDGVEVQVPIFRLVAGDIITVHQGEIIPVDGRVAGGEADVGESQLTGIPHPVWKGLEHPVLAGSEVLHGHLKILVERTGRSTRLNAMIRSVAHHPQAPANQEFQERLDRMVLLSLLVAGSVYIVTRDTKRTLAVLFAGAPVAAGLVLPTAAGVAVGQALDQGIYVRDEKYLLAAAEIDAVVLDKTGTLTDERAEIREITVVGRGHTEQGIIRLAAAVEGRADHAVARALREKAQALHGAPLPAAEESEEIPGFGVRARFRSQNVLIGNHRFMEKEKVNIAKVEAKVRRYLHLGLNPVFVAVNGQVHGLLAVHEGLSPQSGRLIETLRTYGIKKIVLVTRDTNEAAERAAEELGITEYHGELTPEEKAAYVRVLKEQGFKVAMAGDGLDDALAMAEADVGIAVGCMGVDSAAKVAGIVIPEREPERVVETIRLGQKLKKRIDQNLSIAFGLNITGLGLSAAGLFSAVNATVLGNIGIISIMVNSYSGKWSTEAIGKIGPMSKGYSRSTDEPE